MINVIVELSKYTILTLMIVYTFHCFYTVRQPDEEERNELLRQQLILIFFIDFTAFLVIYLKTFDYKVVRFYIEMQIFFAVIQILYRVLYKKASLLLLNNMCMLLSVGFIMLCRLDITMATKQLLVAAGASAVALAIPVMIRKMRFLRKLTWIYAGIGVVLLAAVFLLARTSYGAKLTLLGVQPSEAIKITFVFFMASFLSRDTSLKAVVQVSAVAAFHVGILVLSRDLGSAVIFFVAYLVMVYVSTRNVGYLGLGLVGGSGAAVVAYHLFGHVRQRVSAWKDPMAVYQNEGYQIVQSLFAIGTGGWFGMGLCQGSPESIPVVKNDFIFSAISENFISKFARYYTPAVCYGALALAVLPPLVNLVILHNPTMWSQWIYRALTFLVISCPCALVISIPLSFFAGIGGASNAGVLVKGSNYLETLSETKYVVFDKTGTLTKCKPVFPRQHDIHHCQICILMP